MNTNVRNISEIVEDIKEKLTDYQYKTIMDNLMELNKGKNSEEYEEVEDILEQIAFLKTFIPSICDERTKTLFVERLVLLNRILLEYVLFLKI